MSASAKTVVGRAVAATGRLYLFEDPAWEERFEVLMRLTQRTELIQALTGTDASPDRIKAAINKRMADMGADVQRPRGVGQRYTAKGFLAKMIDKYDAAYLLNLHFGANGPSSCTLVETNLGAALDKRIETYLRYRSDLYENPEDARLSFETYVVMLDGIRNQAVPIHTCRDCNTKYAWPSGGYSTHSCPVCAIHQHDAAESKRKIEALIEQKKRDKRKVKELCYG